MIRHSRPRYCLRALGLLLACGCAHVGGAPSAARIEATPADALVDAPVAVRLRGLAPHARVTVTATTPLEDHVMRAAATYVADAQGRVDVATTAPESGGSYRGVDAMGLFWSMARDTTAGRQAGASAEAFSPPEPFTVTLTVTRESKVLATTVVRRRFMAPGVVVRDVAEAGVIARLYLPPRASARLPVVISLTGSEGGYERLRAPLLASHGYAALAVPYFRAPGLPEELFEIPVETIERAVAWIRRQPQLDGERIAIRGASRGGELALLAASLIPEIRAVIAEVPNDVVGQGIDRRGQSRPVSAWTWRGRPLPFLRQTPPPEFTQQFERHGPPYRLRPLAEASRRDTAGLHAARIAVERINGPVLFISAEDDQFGPSEEQSDAAVARLRAAGFRFDVRHVRNPGAGHQILVPFLPAPIRIAGQFWLTGGTPERYARADGVSWRETRAFLAATIGAKMP